MFNFVVRRLIRLVLVMLTVYTMVFFVARVIPGGPFEEGELPLDPQTVENLRRHYRLDRPVWQQYVTNLWLVVRHGDLGPSYISAHRTVNDILGDHFPISLKLGLVAIVLAIVLGVPIGILSAVRHNTAVDRGGMLFALVGVSVPNFVMTPLLIIVFAVWLRLLPSGGWEGVFSAKALIPAVALAFLPAAALARYTRASMLGVLGMDYVRTARAKGLPEVRIVARHALRNALIPVLTRVVLAIPFLFTGSLLLEAFFGIPGLGAITVDAINNNDFATLRVMVYIGALLFIGGQILTDISYSVADPRVRFD